VSAAGVVSCRRVVRVKRGPRGLEIRVEGSRGGLRRRLMCASSRRDTIAAWFRRWAAGELGAGSWAQWPAFLGTAIRAEVSEDGHAQLVLVSESGIREVVEIVHPKTALALAGEIERA
jgi:hypothetical protein